MSHRENRAQWNAFINALKQEVKPALGCTEPVSVALACAVAAQQLSGAVVRIDAAVAEFNEKWNGRHYPGHGDDRPASQRPWALSPAIRRPISRCSRKRPNGK
jgi:hypothetical protein